MQSQRAIGIAAAAVLAAWVGSGTGALRTALAQETPAAGGDASNNAPRLELTLLVDDEGAKKPVTIVPTGARLTVSVRALADGTLDPTASGEVTLAGLVHADGDRAGKPPVLSLQNGEASLEYVVATGETVEARASFAQSATPELNVFSGWLCLAPPLIALALAIATRAVLPSLFAGVWMAATVIFADGPLTGLLRSLDKYLVEAITDGGHAMIITFTVMLGGMTAVIARSGGTHGVVDAIAPIATTPRRGLLATWALGIAVFFDDYANTLIVGPTMRPVTDRLKVSREKLAYVVDSTAAPIAAIALVSTWIGTELGYIGDGYRALGIDEDPYQVFVYALPGRFYSIMAIVMVAMTILLRRDIGPMARAEARAARGEGVLSPTAKPAGGAEIEQLEPPEGAPRRWPNAALPILTVVIVTLVGLWFTGTDSALGKRKDAVSGAEAAVAAATDEAVRVEAEAALAEAQEKLEAPWGLAEVIGSSDSYSALIWASFLGAALAIVLAVVQRILSLAEATEAFVSGAKAMVPALAILVLAWALGSACKELLTGNYVAALLQGNLPIALVPAVTFVACAGIAFATGTSWGTMGLMLPLSIAVAGELLRGSLPEGQTMADQAYNVILLGTIVAVLDGAIFGDHCSPISDTTVLSSMASSSDHIDHVRTQLPYALIGAGAALVLGYLPYGFGLPAPIGLILGLALIAGVLRTFGSARPDEADPPATAAPTAAA